MAENIDHMSPDASPGTPSKKTGVRRVNNLPLIIALCALALFVLLIAMVAVKRSNQQNAVHEDAPTKKNTDSSTMALDVVGGRGAGLIPADKPASAGTVAGVPIAPVSNPDAPPSPPSHAGNGNPVPIDPDLDRIRQAKAQQFEEAVKAKTEVKLPLNRDGAGKLAATPDPAEPTSRDDMLARIAAVRRQIDQSPASGGDPNLVYQAQLAKVKANLAGAGGGDGGDSDSGPQLLAAAGGSHNEVQQFAGNGQGDRWKLDGAVQAPRSRYEVRAGGVIPGVMISGVNSDLPGQIMGQVSQDVFDTATGKYLLIPHGTRLVGTYSSNVAYGQNAVLIAWQRLVFPDGKALDIGAMPGADMAGYSGFRDQVNNHFIRIFGSALLMSGVTAGASYATDRNSNSGNTFQQPTASSELSQALGQQLGNATAQMISKNLNIAPTIEIRPGYRLNIVVVKDLDFTKPYKSFDY